MDPADGAPTPLPPWAGLLHDPSPFDLLISTSFLAAIGIISVLCVRRGIADRRRWAAVAALLVALLVNQQGDLHESVIRAGARWVRHLAEAIGAPTATDLIRAALLIGAAVVGVALMRGFGPRGPARPTAGFGLLLLLVHAAGRAAADLGAAPGWLGADAIHPFWKTFELAGLMVIAAAALRASRPQPSTLATGASAPVKAGIDKESCPVRTPRESPSSVQPTGDRGPE
jgi:hypothetical protein